MFTSASSDCTIIPTLKFFAINCKKTVLLQHEDSDTIFSYDIFYNQYNILIKLNLVTDSFARCLSIKVCSHAFSDSQVEKNWSSDSDASILNLNPTRTGGLVKLRHYSFTNVSEIAALSLIISASLFLNLFRIFW